MTNCDSPPATTYTRPHSPPETTREDADLKQRLKLMGQHAWQATRRGVKITLESVERRQVRLKHRFRDLHLSDGGHFENLGLYELIRRHCRYIIVSDCGADPEIAFDDFAIALRTVREDFGVEIEIDVSPLRPGETGRSKQHAVIGTIHYDGLRGLDKGTLLYFKPTLTGDEPPDVLQYQTRNTAFPHESTGDQFYDEAQWESYRRLGQHAGNLIFHFAEKHQPKSEERFVENLFLEARRLWDLTPDRKSEAYLALAQRCIDLETEIRENAPQKLREEFFPEVRAAFPRNRITVNAHERKAPQDEELQTLYFLMLTAQVMEDIWTGAELEMYWSHPLNDGWMNYLQRWAAMPSFRRWWPVLRPICSIGFRDFVRERFNLTYAKNADEAGAVLSLESDPKRTGLAWTEWSRSGELDASPDRQFLEFQLKLDSGEGDQESQPVSVGLLRFSKIPDEEAVEWCSEDLFVAKALKGAGIIARFLDAVVERLRDDGMCELRVVFKEEKRRPDPATRLERLHEINFYKSRGFSFEQPVADDGHVRLIFRRSKYSA